MEKRIAKHYPPMTIIVLCAFEQCYLPQVCGQNTLGQTTVEQTQLPDVKICLIHFNPFLIRCGLNGQARCHIFRVTSPAVKRMKRRLEHLKLISAWPPSSIFSARLRSHPPPSNGKQALLSPLLADIFFSRKYTYLHIFSELL